MAVHNQPQGGRNPLSSNVVLLRLFGWHTCFPNADSACFPIRDIPSTSTVQRGSYDAWPDHGTLVPLTPWNRFCKLLRSPPDRCSRCRLCQAQRNKLLDVRLQRSSRFCQLLRPRRISSVRVDELLSAHIAPVQPWLWRDARCRCTHRPSRLQHCWHCQHTSYHSLA